MGKVFAFLLVAVGGYFGWKYYQDHTAVKHVVIYGRVMSQDEQGYLNNRLAILFLGESELAREVSATAAGYDGETADNGIVRLSAELPYTISISQIQLPDGAKTKLEKSATGDFKVLHIDLGNLNERNILTAMPVPDKKDTLTVGIPGGNVSGYTEVMLKPHTFGLAAGQNLYLGRFWWQPQAPRQGLLVEAVDFSEKLEPLETRQLILENCGHSALKRKTWHLHQMFPIETKMYGETYASAEPTLLQSLKALTEASPQAISVPLDTAAASHDQDIEASAEGGQITTTVVRGFKRFLVGTARLVKKPTDQAPYQISNGLVFTASHQSKACR